jgi:hypothetical protein
MEIGHEVRVKKEDTWAGELRVAPVKAQNILP